MINLNYLYKNNIKELYNKSLFYKEFNPNQFQISMANIKDRNKICTINKNCNIQEYIIQRAIFLSLHKKVLIVCNSVKDIANFRYKIIQQFSKYSLLKNVYIDGFCGLDINYNNRQNQYSKKSGRIGFFLDKDGLYIDPNFFNYIFFYNYNFVEIDSYSLDLLSNDNIDITMFLDEKNSKMFFSNNHISLQPFGYVYIYND